jgi:isopropylmalate/homocitrate/citramalate synthase
MITLVDNTLREGEQTPGVALSVRDKMELAAALVESGINFLDGALPESFADEKEFLRLASREFPDLRLGASTRLIRDSILRARDNGAGEVFVIVPISDVHLEKRLKIDRNTLLERMETQLASVATQVSINIALEDAFRASPEFLIRTVQKARELGAARVFLSDTVGMVAPWQVEPVVRAVSMTAGGDLGIGTHFHNDMGLALANTLAAIRAGATFPTAALNGLGERAGNTDIMHLAATVRFLLDEDPQVDLPTLRKAAALAMKKTGILVAQNTPITGHNAFRHTSGMHVHGWLEDRETYEGIAPKEVGAQAQLVLGKHSGRAHLRHLLGAAGKLPEDQLDTLLRQVKRLCVGEGKEERIAGIIDNFQQFNNEVLGICETQFEQLVKAVVDAVDDS